MLIKPTNVTVIDYAFKYVSLFSPIQGKQLYSKERDTLEMLIFYLCFPWDHFWIKSGIQVAETAKIILQNWH